MVRVRYPDLTILCGYVKKTETEVLRCFVHGAICIHGFASSERGLYHFTSMQYSVTRGFSQSLTLYGPSMARNVLIISISHMDARPLSPAGHCKNDLPPNGSVRETTA